MKVFVIASSYSNYHGDEVAFKDWVEADSVKEAIKKIAIKLNWIDRDGNSFDCDYFEDKVDSWGVDDIIVCGGVDEGEVCKYWVGDIACS